MIFLKNVYLKGYSDAFQHNLNHLPNLIITDNTFILLCLEKEQKRHKEKLWPVTKFHQKTFVEKCRAYIDVSLHMGLIFFSEDRIIRSLEKHKN